MDLGKACGAYQGQAFRRLNCFRVQVDEIWAFCYAKQRNVQTAKAAPDVAGDVWTWTAIDADTKMVFSWVVGDRSKEACETFVDDFASRIMGRFQLTSDGLKQYKDAIENKFGRTLISRSL